MKTVKIKYLDWWSGFDIESYLINRILEKHYEVVLSDEPDYVIGSMYTKEALNYNCIRIFYSGENFSPDFNLYDYALGFDQINYGDRYVYAPNYIMNPKYADDVEKMFVKHTQKEIEKKRKTEFCSFVVSNGVGNSIRFDFFNELSKYKRVNSGGRFQNNIGLPSGVPDKYDFQQKHKFSICFENSSHPGYITEKLVQGFAAGTVPIYWGAPDVSGIFNEKAMVVVKGMYDIPRAIDQIKIIDNDDDLYRSMLEQPALVDQNFINGSLQKIEDFLINIFNQSINDAVRRPDIPMVESYYNNMRQTKTDPKRISLAKKIIDYMRK